MLDLGSGGSAAQQVAVHEQPIRCVETIMVQGSPMLVTGSWDKTVKYWDLRQQQPAATLQCQDRVYTMSVKDSLLVIGTAERWLNIVNLATPDKFYKSLQSPLKWQTRVVSCFADASGFAVGSIEGRCAIQYVEDKDSGYVTILSRFIPSLLTLLQLQLFLQVPPSKRTQSARRCQRLLRERNLLPPSTWNIQYFR